VGSLLKKAGKAADAVFNANDAATTQAGALGIPPSPASSAVSTAGDIVQLGKSAHTIAQPGPAPNSAWGNALLSGGKLLLSMLGESVMPGGGADMAGMVIDQAKAAGDVMLPDGTAGTIGNIVHKVSGGALGGGPEETAAPTPAAEPEVAAPPPQQAVPAAPPPVAAPVPVAPPPRQFPDSPLASDEEVRERLSR
jgi:hypothetical protein